VESLLITFARNFADLGTEGTLFYAWVIFVGINLTAFALFGIDKRRSINGQWRIREITLLKVAFFGGWAGAYAGRSYFRHKTANSHSALIWRPQASATSCSYPDWQSSRKYPEPP
jgi:uncharacterized membrane protein YsdA (DUF1294 family)